MGDTRARDTSDIRGSATSATQHPKGRERATERTRQYRRRLAPNALVVPVEVALDVIGLLIDLGWLAIGESATAKHIKAGL
jgi:hypothetical protein